MIEPDPDMFLFSTFTDAQLLEILDKYGPHVKDAFLTTDPVPIEGAAYAPLRSD